MVAGAANAVVHQKNATEATKATRRCGGMIVKVTACAGIQIIQLSIVVDT